MSLGGSHPRGYKRSTNIPKIQTTHPIYFGSDGDYGFGQAKSKYGLDDILTRRQDTSYACIGLILLAFNLIMLSGAVFVSFYQVNDSATRMGEGSGIGLALVKE